MGACSTFTTAMCGDPDDQHKPVAWTDLEGDALASAMREVRAGTRSSS